MSELLAINTQWSLVAICWTTLWLLFI